MIRLTVALLVLCFGVARLCFGAEAGDAGASLSCQDQFTAAIASGTSPPDAAKVLAGCRVMEELKATRGVVVTDQSAPGAVEIDLSVPDSPAFAVLNITPESVIRPTSTRQLAVGILQGSDPNGVLQSGIAIEFTPSLFFKDSPDRTLANYRSRYGMRFFERSQISLATAKSTTDEKALRLALGYRATLWDLGDPRNDLVLGACLREANAQIAGQATDEVALRNKLREQVQIGFGDDLITGNAAFQRLYGNEADFRRALTASLKGLQKACRDRAVKRNENRSAWVLGVSPTWLSEDGSTGDLDYTGSALWTSLAYGFDTGFLETEYLKDHAQLILHVRYREEEIRESDQSPTGFIEQDTFLAALQFRVDGPKVFGDEESNRLRFGLDVSYSDDDVDQLEDDDYFKYSLFTIARIREDAYLKVSIGSEDGRSVETNESFVTATLNWAFPQNQ